jgi:hypothetical protein
MAMWLLYGCMCLLGDLGPPSGVVFRAVTSVTSPDVSCSLFVNHGEIKKLLLAVVVLP